MLLNASVAMIATSDNVVSLILAAMTANPVILIYSFI